MPAAEELTVSIVISSYNYESFLRQTIESALAQSHPRTEVVVVDDGSTDDSRAIIETFGARIIVVLKDNGGQASSLNAGFAACHGDVVIFLDSDDLLLPHAAASAAAALADGVAVKVHWAMEEIDERGVRRAKLHPPRPLADGDQRELIIQKGPGCHGWPPTSGNAWSRPLLERLLPMPEREYVTCPDAYLCELAPLFGPVRKLPQAQSLYRWHGNNNMTGVDNEQKRRLLKLSAVAVERLLIESGVRVSREDWTNGYVAWLEEVRSTAEAIAAIVPRGLPFLLLDDEQIRAELPQQLQALPFPGRNGTYWGVPPDDCSAASELDRSRPIADFLVIVRSSFWWIEHFPTFSDHLREGFELVLDDPLAKIFHLRHAPRQK